MSGTDFEKQKPSENLVTWIPVAPEDEVLVIGTHFEEYAEMFSGKGCKVSGGQKREDDWEIPNQPFSCIFVSEVKLHKKLTEKLFSHLAEDGKLFFCCNNPLGMSGLAGNVSDNEEVYFSKMTQKREGMYTKAQLSRFFGKDAKFYYPYPDLTDTEYLFTDERNPGHEDFLKDAPRYATKGLNLFSEGNFALQLVEEGVFSTFSNAFLVEVSKGKTLPVIYEKFSDKRGISHQIRTEIFYDASGEKKVRKYPVTKEADAHLKKMFSNGEKLQKLFAGSDFTLSVMEEDYTSCFHKGMTLDEKLDELLEKDEDAAKEELQRVLTAMQNLPSEPFAYTKEFTELFAVSEKQLHDVYNTKEIKTHSITDVDLIFGNIITDGTALYVIDYEWCVDIPVPVEFLIYRCLRYYLDGKTIRKQRLTHEVYADFGISREMRTLFEQMEEGFQAYIHKDEVQIKEAPVCRFHLLETVGRMQCLLQPEVFLDYGEGFTPFYEYDLNPDEIHVKVPANVREVRIDPSAMPGILSVVSCVDETGADVSFRHNGHRMDEKIYFETNDPMLLFGAVKEIRLSYRYDCFMRSDDEKEQLERIASMELTPPTELRGEVFFDFGQGFSETGKQEFCGGTLELEIPKEVKQVRIDPASAPGMFTLESCKDENGKDLSFAHNGYKTDNTILYTTDDPMLIFSGCNFIRLRYVYDEFAKTKDEDARLARIKGLGLASNGKSILKKIGGFLNGNK